MAEIGTHILHEHLVRIADHHGRAHDAAIAAGHEARPAPAPSDPPPPPPPAEKDPSRGR